MRNFWALPAALRVAIAAQIPFSVQNDLLAFPQYEIIYSDNYIPEREARDLLAKQSTTTPDPHYEPPSESEQSEKQQRDVQPQHPLHADPHHSPLDPNTPDPTYERLLFEEIPYLCTIPHVTRTPQPSPTKSAAEEAQALTLAADHGWRLLKGMQEQQCLYYGAGWWVYSFCYNEGIRQFHPLPPGRGGVPVFPPQEDRGIMANVLGRFDVPVVEERETGSGATEETTAAKSTDTPTSDAATADAPITDAATSDASTDKELTPTPPGSTLQTRGSTHYLVQTLDGGTKCDLTGRPRRIEVQFHCNPSKTDHISMIKETASCVYLMVIHTPRLCNDVAFLPPQVEKPNVITCQEVVADEGVEEWKAWKEEVARELLADLQIQDQQVNAVPGLDGNDDGVPVQPPPAQQPLVVGGIVVGGQKLVGGSPERTIKASGIVSASANKGKETFLATLAKSDGKTIEIMGDDRMDELGLKAVKEEAAKYRERLKNNAAGGVPWKLELWRTGNGEEFRMFIGMDVEDVEEASKDSKEAAAVDEKEDSKGSKESKKKPPQGSEEEYH